MPIGIYIVDDHKIFRDGIISLINYEDDMKVIGSAGSIEEFMGNILNHSPDIILMDISLKDGEGTNAATWLKEQGSDAKILILSMHRDEKYVKKVIDSGANGYLLKDAGTEEMLKAIKTVYDGHPFYSPEIMNTMVKQLVTGNSPKKELAGQKLTRREVEVLKLIAEENSNQEIADLLFISIRTVNTHRTNLMNKLKVKNTAGLVRYAIKNGITEL